MNYLTDKDLDRKTFGIHLTNMTREEFDAFDAEIRLTRKFLEMFG